MSLIFALGCSTTYTLQGTSGVAPGAMGKLESSTDDNGNTQLKLNVEHLAPADRILTGASGYVVWIQPGGQAQYQNVGALSVGESRRGELSFITPHQNFKLIVTPEAVKTAASPTGIPVYEQTINR